MMAMPVSLIDFSLNRRYITENLCENRFKNGVGCAGKCYLQKQLAKSNENHPSSDQKGSVRFQLIDFCETFDRPCFGISETPCARNLLLQTPALISRSPENIFHPPIV
jgi:hypothetical protein